MAFLSTSTPQAVTPVGSTVATVEWLTLASMKSSFSIAGTVEPAEMWMAVALAS